MNIEKYQELVRKTIEKNKSHVDKAVSEEVQSIHWNHVHSILSKNINDKTSIVSNSVLEELMKQSAYNKQWVEG